MTRFSSAAAGGAIMAALALAAPSARAADFYQGKTVTVLSPAGEGGGYDAYARLVARHLPRHIPGAPAAVVVNRPGASGIVAANHVFAVAAPDGLTIAGLYRQTPFAPLFGTEGARFDAQKFGWIGTSSRFLDDASFLFVHKRLGVRTVDDLRKLAKPLQFGTAGRASTGDEGARIIAPALGIPLKIIRGYKSSAHTLLAVESGEVDGMILGLSSLGSQKPEWLKPGSDVTFVFQFGYGGDGRHPQFPDVPRIDELATSAEDKGLFLLLQAPFRIARPFAAPPGVPADRLGLLRAGFMATHADPAFLAEAKKLALDISPMTGEEVAKTVADVYRLPPSAVTRYVEALEKAD